MEKKAITTLVWTVAVLIVLVVVIVVFIIPSNGEDQINSTFSDKKPDLQVLNTISAGEPFDSGDCLVEVRDSDFAPWMSYEFVEVDLASRTYSVQTRSNSQKNNMDNSRQILESTPGVDVDSRILEEFGPQTMTFDQIDRGWTSRRGYTYYPGGCPNEYTYSIA